MSREQKLSKKIAHTLLAMSIVYSGGMNVFVIRLLLPVRVLTVQIKRKCDGD